MIFHCFYPYRRRSQGIPTIKTDYPCSALIRVRFQPIIVSINTLFTFDKPRTFICLIKPTDLPQPKGSSTRFLLRWLTL